MAAIGLVAGAAELTDSMLAVSDVGACVARLTHRCRVIGKGASYQSVVSGNRRSYKGMFRPPLSNIAPWVAMTERSAMYTAASLMTGDVAAMGSW